MQLKLDTLHLLVGKFLSIAFVCAFPCQFFQIIGFELDTVETVVAAQLLHLLLGIFLAHDDIAMLITGELVEQVFLSEFLTVFLLGTKVLGDGEFGHDRVGVDAVGFHLVDDLLGVLQHFGMVGEDTPHLFWRLQPFLLGVVHTRWVIEVFARAQADETVMGLAVFFLHKVDVIGGDDLDLILLCQIKDNLVHLFLSFVNFGVATGFVGLMTLYLKIVIFAKEVLEPSYRGFGALHVAIHDFLWHLTCEACRTTDQAFMVFFKQAMVDAGIIIETFSVGDGTQFAEAVIARLVLGQ